jgi:putative DNA primase/helicase
MNLKKYSVIEIADELIKTKLPPLVQNNNELYQFNGKYYSPTDDFELHKTIQQLYLESETPDSYGPSKANNIISTLKYNPNIVNVPHFDDYDHLINLNNGALDLEEESLVQHSPDLYFSSISQVDYRPELSTAPNFLKFLETTFTTQENKPDHATIQNILRIGGYLIYPQNKIEGLFMFLGEGANGKSLLIDIFSSFFDPKFITSMSLKAMAREASFERAELITSRFNISGEEKGDRPIDAEQIKKITSGQYIQVARKFKEPINIKPRAKIVVDSNTIPRFKDNTYGTSRRLNLIRFPNRFVSKEDLRKIDDPSARRIFERINKDVFFKEILKERSAILNLFLLGLRELKELDWQLPITKNSQDMTDEYEEEVDTFKSWLMDNYEPDNSEQPQFKDVHEILRLFTDWYNINFPNTQTRYSTRYVAKRIREIFRLESEPRNIYINSMRTKTIAFPIIRREIEDDLSEIDFDKPRPPQDNTVDIKEYPII